MSKYPKSTKLYKCPTCSEPFTTKVKSFPFCTERCQLLDLGKWANGSYAIPTEEVPSEEEFIKEAPQS